MSNEEWKEYKSLMRVIKTIRKRERGKRGVVGAIPCPDCNADLRYSIGDNGNIHGKCSGCGVEYVEREAV